MIKDGTPGMRVCVVGSGIAGLCAAHYLSRYEGVDVTMVERATHPGGRADVTAGGGEHCPRVFLDDYHHLFEILREIPLSDGSSIHAGLRKLVRYCHSGTSGWVPISHLYRFHSPEIPLRERLRLALAMSRTPLVADSALNTNRYGSLRNYSLSSLVRVGKNLLRSRDGYALDGPTDELLVVPWLDHLVRRGMHFRPATPAEGISSHRDGVLVRLDGGWEEYDAAVVTAYLPDVLDLIPVLPVARATAGLPHSHCACLTVTLDAREDVVARGEVALYFRHSLAVLIQPTARRCVVMCLRPHSTDTGWVMQRLREMLDLRHDVVGVLRRENHSPAEAVFTAEPLRVADVVADGMEHVYLAGSYLKSRYPIDAAECAAQTAFAAVEHMRARYALVPAGAPITTGRPVQRLDDHRVAGR